MTNTYRLVSPTGHKEIVCGGSVGDDKDGGHSIYDFKGKKVAIVPRDWVIFIEYYSEN